MLISMIFHSRQGRCLALALGLLAPMTGFVEAQDSKEPRLASLSVLIRDPSPKVRLEALRALAKIHSGESAALALSVLNQPMDPTLDYALWLTINDLADPWIAALQSGAWKPEGREKQLEFALKALRPEQASRVLGQILASRPLNRSGDGPWIELIGAAGSSRELQSLWDSVRTSALDEKASVRGLKALEDAYRLRKVRPEKELTALAGLIQGSGDAVRAEALRLAGVWKDTTLMASVVQVAGSSNISADVRSAAFDTLRQLGGKEAQAALVSLAGSKDVSVRRQALVSLAGVDLGAALPVLHQMLGSIRDEAVALEVWRGVLSVKGAGKRIAESLPPSGVTPEMARAGMRAAREGGRNEIDLVLALAKGAGLAGSGDVSASLIKDLAAKAQAQGNPQRGESIYRRSELGCMNCHAIGGVGGKVGPDMTSIGASAPVDYLVESVLLPNAKIKEGYHSVVLSLKDGTEATGTLARETTQEIILRTATGKEQAVAKAEVEKRDLGTLSLMPGGLLDPLNEQEQLDLFAFLSRLGKPGEFDAAQGGVARFWRIGLSVHTDAQSGQERWPFDAAWTDRRWIPTPALVRGALTQSLIHEATKASVWTGRLGIYAGTDFQMSKAGSAQFQLRAGKGAELWIDGKKVGGEGSSSVSLSAGTHRVLVRLNPYEIPSEIRLESKDGAFALN